ncbi:hypothetical protein HHK36_028102 [Tetracentron sinense]|uniref:Myb-like domain-containing protein n=1 Tax=Tetracentron sinense TaxID=13715 RepID=A0A834YG03_TETSI|nr:hypothetical protein HHK36_028102 [Tetracentron sinense]
MVMAASSSSAPDPSSRPTPQPSRRLPPPCWSHEETGALIDAYREKWYSLRRGNLRASHWQEVADSVALLCPLASPSKTSVQCRHKIEKLRKRYRNEKQRSLSAPNRSSSPWVYFKKMDSMEKGPSSAPIDSDPAENFDEDDEEDEKIINSHSFYRPMINGRSGGGPIPVPATVTGFRSKKSRGVDENPKPNVNSRFLNGCSSWGSVLGRRGGDEGGKREMDPVAEMVSSIKLLGEGFVKMEQMKMETAREIERMRMDMEMKRTEMILESQQRIVDAFANGLSEKKKKKLKRMQSPDS